METPPKSLSWRYSKRVQYRRRESMVNEPMIIMNFEGVIGDFFKANLWDKGPMSLYLRPGYLMGLKQLLTKFQVVLFCSLKRSRYQQVIDIFASKGIVFDSVYIRREHKEAKERFLQDYSQVFFDFQVKSTSDVLVVSQISLDYNEINQRKDHHIIYDRATSSHKRILCSHLPHGNGAIQPATLLFPNPR